MYESKVNQLVEQSKPVTLDAISSDLNNDCWDALYFATEKQISSLIDSGMINEDFFSRHQDYQEEMRCLKSEAQSEFS
jgi:hypothetical protein